MEAACRQLRLTKDYFITFFYLKILIINTLIENINPIDDNMGLQ